MKRKVRKSLGRINISSMGLKELLPVKKDAGNDVHP